MATDARFWRPNNVLIRQGDWVFTYVEFYGLTTTAYTELRAYNSAGQMLYYPFTDADSIQGTTSSALITYQGTQIRQIGTIWNFKNAYLSGQAVSFHVWLWSNGYIIDYW